MSDWTHRIPKHLVDAYLRAHGRENLRRMGMTESDLPDGMRIEAAGYLKRPDQCSPHETLEAVSLGKRLARKYGW